MGKIIGKIDGADNSFTIQYQTDAEVCSQIITITIKGDTIESAHYVGGCSGNTQGIGALIKGMKINDAISRLEGIRCGRKTTSCPDQLAKALKELI